MTNHISGGAFCTKIRSLARGFNLKFKFHCVSLDVISFFLIFTRHMKTISHFLSYSEIKIYHSVFLRIIIKKVRLLTFI